MYIGKFIRSKNPPFYYYSIFEGKKRILLVNKISFPLSVAFSNRGNLAKVSVFPTLGHERSVFKPTWRQLTWLCAYARHTRGIAHWVTLTLAIDTGPYDTLTQKSTPWPELLRLSRHTRQEGGGGGREREIEKKEALSRTMLRYFTERYSDFRVTKRSRWNLLLYYYYYYYCCFFFFSLFLFFFFRNFSKKNLLWRKLSRLFEERFFFLFF